MISNEDRLIKLKDGRKAAFTEHGNLNGKPVFFIHGNPGCRLQRHPNESIAEKLNVRIITPDRPGYGLSDNQKNRKLLDYPEDIIQIADNLKLDKFYVFGVSAGGPYTAACAFTLSDRIVKAAIVSGPKPLNLPNAYEGMSPIWKKAFKAASLPKWILAIIYKSQSKLFIKKPEAAVDQFAKILSESDKQLLEQKDFRKGVIERRRESTRQGVMGMIQEAKILTSAWGFDPSEIKIPVHLWYWQNDPAIPIQMGKYLKEIIPNSIPHFFDDGGHLSLFEKWEEILKTLTE